MLDNLFRAMLEEVSEELNSLTLEELAMRHFIHSKMDVAKVHRMVQAFRNLLKGCLDEKVYQNTLMEEGLKSLALNIFAEMGTSVDEDSSYFRMMFEALEAVCDDEIDFMEFIEEVLAIDNGDYDDEVEECDCNDCSDCYARHKEAYIKGLYKKGLGILPIGSCISGKCGRCNSCIESIVKAKMVTIRESKNNIGDCEVEEHTSPNLVYRKFKELEFEGTGELNLKLEKGMKAVVKLMISDEE